MNAQEFVDLLNNSNLTAEMLFEDFGEYCERNDITAESEETEAIYKLYETQYKEYWETYKERSDEENEVIKAEFYKTLDHYYNTLKNELVGDLNEALTDLVTVKTEGGNEGGGDHVELVVHSPSLGFYAKATSYYSSYYGVHHDSWTKFHVVKPVDKIVRFYE